MFIHILSIRNKILEKKKKIFFELHMLKKGFSTAAVLY